MVSFVIGDIEVHDEERGEGGVVYTVVVKWNTKNTILSEQFIVLIESCRNIGNMYTPNTNIVDHFISWIGKNVHLNCKV